MKRIRILIADDHHVVRTGLRALLRGEPGLSVIAEACDGEEAVHRVAELKPDVAILDISMPGLNGVDAARLIKRDNPSTRVLILTIHENEEYVYQVVRAGADGYVLKNADKKELCAAVRAVVDGRRFFSPSVSNLIISEFAKRVQDEEGTESPASRVLTPRETDVLRRIAQGMTSKAIAAELFLSIRTVNTHRANLMHKLDIHETAGLVRYAIQTGLVDVSGGKSGPV
jgi:DNA-binding NarL/FixJ family response regulator